METKNKLRVDITSYLGGSGSTKCYKDVKDFEMHNNCIEFKYDNCTVYLPISSCEIRKYFV